jgi:hypothetical protein
VWLIALHLSLAQLASELVIGIRSPPAKGVPVSRKEYDELRLEVARVESRISKRAAQARGRGRGRGGGRGRRGRRQGGAGERRCR